jgi:hypothetical protein
MCVPDFEVHIFYYSKAKFFCQEKSEKRAEKWRKTAFVMLSLCQAARIPAPPFQGGGLRLSPQARGELLRLNHAPRRRGACFRRSRRSLITGGG